MCYRLPSEYNCSKIVNSTPKPQCNIFEETDVILTKDQWRIAVDFDLNMYQEVISTIRADIFIVEQQKKEFTSVSEVKQMETYRHFGI